MNTDFSLVMQNLEKNNMKPFYVKTRAEVVPLVSQLLCDGDVVTAGGSMSLFDAGVIEYLKCGRYRFLNRYETGLSEADIADIYFQAMKADAYFCSCNAVTKAGELYNVDGNANRISAIAHGPRSVIMVVGKNKVVETLADAVHRVKTVTAPMICKKRGNNTYCSEKGHCVSIDKGQTDMTAGCSGPGRSCCSYLVTGKQRIKDRIKLILVDEELGY